MNEQTNEEMTELPKFVAKIVTSLSERFKDLHWTFLDYIPEKTIEDQKILKVVKDMDPIGTVLVGECITPTVNFKSYLKSLLDKESKPLVKRDVWVDHDIFVKQLILASDEGKFVSMIICPKMYIDYLGRSLLNQKFYHNKPFSGFVFGL